MSRWLYENCIQWHTKDKKKIGLILRRLNIINILQNSVNLNRLINENSYNIIKSLPLVNFKKLAKSVSLNFEI